MGTQITRPLRERAQVPLLRLPALATAILPPSRGRGQECLRILESSRGGGLRILESSTGACRYGTSRASAPPSVEDNARLDAPAGGAPALTRRLITVLDMVFHRRARRLAASTAADYRMFKNSQHSRAPLSDGVCGPGRGRLARRLVVRRRELQRRGSVAGAADNARRRRDRRGRGRGRRRRWASCCKTLASQREGHGGPYDVTTRAKS